MPDLEAVLSTVRQNFSAAQSGDEEARLRLRGELWPLSSKERREVAKKLEQDGNVSVVRGSDRSVRSITFSPSILGRISGYFSTRPVHAIQITSPITENLNASSSAYSQLRQEYEQLPAGVRQMLVDKRFVIAIGETMSQALPNFGKKSSSDPVFGGNSEPDRYAAQIFPSEHRIVLAEKTKAADGNYQANSIRSVLREEVGLAANDNMGAVQLSKNEAFRKALCDDLAEVPQEVRNRYHRYIVPRQGGPAELFAVEFELLTRSTNDDLTLEREDDIHRYFKRSLAVARSLLGASLSEEQQQRLSKLEKDAQLLPPAVPSLDSTETFARQVLAGIAQGQIGDRHALDQIDAALDKLNDQERLKLGEQLAWVLGTSINSGPGIKIERDVIGHIRSMTFFPVGREGVKERRVAVEIPSPVVENYNSSDEHYRLVDAEVQRLPPKVFNYLKEHHWVIATSHSMLEGVPELDKSYGTPTGLACPSHDCAAGVELPAEKRIVIAEYSKSSQGDWFGNRHCLEWTVRHEVGHAIDNALDQISRSQEFGDAYRKDVAAIPESVRAKLPYYLQDGLIGPREMFAQLFSIILRRSDDSLKDLDENRLLHQYMGNTEQVIIEKMGDWLQR